jgi:hypothetical protein
MLYMWSRTSSVAGAFRYLFPHRLWTVRVDFLVQRLKRCGLRADNGKQLAALEGAGGIRGADEVRGAMTFEYIYFGYTGDGMSATESYPGVPPW